MISDEIRKSLSKRIATDDEWAHGVDLCCNEEIDILSCNIEDTIEFLENECTANEFSWLSEVFDDVAEKTQSRAFVDCLYKVAKKFPDECREYHIDKVLEYAEGALDD